MKRLFIALALAVVLMIVGLAFPVRRVEAACSSGSCTPYSNCGTVGLCAGVGTCSEIGLGACCYSASCSSSCSCGCSAFTCTSSTCNQGPHCDPGNLNPDICPCGCDPTCGGGTCKSCCLAGQCPTCGCSSNSTDGGICKPDPFCNPAHGGKAGASTQCPCGCTPSCGGGTCNKCCLPSKCGTCGCSSDDASGGVCNPAICDAAHGGQDSPSNECPFGCQPDCDGGDWYFSSTLAISLNNF